MRCLPCSLVAAVCWSVWFVPAGPAAERGAEPVSGATVRRVEGMADAVALSFRHGGGLDPERLRIYFDTEPGAGEPGSGGDYLVEGPSFYAYPQGATGWTWERIGAPAFARRDGELVCVVSAPGLGKKFSWFAEVTGGDWQVAQRWPASGAVAVDPSRLEALPPPEGEAAPDMSELLAARPVSLSVALNGGPDLSRWTPVGRVAEFAGADELFARAGLPAGARPRFALRDAAEAAGAARVELKPSRAWRRENAAAWAGETEGVEWVLVADLPAGGGLRLTGWLRDDRVRLLRVEAGLELPARDRVWWDDMETSRPVREGDAPVGNFASGRYGIDARQSYYPFGVLEDADGVLVAETDPSEPRVFAVEASRMYLSINYDMALSPDTAKFPGQATFRASFHRTEAAGEGGFRAALAGFFLRHPDYAERRVPHSGLWMPFSDISKLPQPEDFGFSFFEKVGDLGADVDHAEANGVLTLMYSEPWLYWLPFNDGEERTPARAEEKMRHLAALGSGWSRDLAASGLAGATRGADGAILMKFMDLPWNKGARMEVSSDPDRAPASPGGLNRAAAEWKRIAAWLADPRVDGIYLDSMDAIVQPDHSPAALASADHPATFTRAGRAPVVAPNVPQYEFTAALGAALRARGKFLMANFPLVDSPFLNRWIDIPGEETDWWSGGQYNPNSRARLDYRRALSGRKPFGFLQSTDFATFEGEPLRRYFETCLLYGFQPSFFSHNAADNPYWHDHKLLERDRPLFRTFIPLTRRVADAGWQPVREARLADVSGLRLEQFGRSADGLWHLVVQNLSDTRRATGLALPAGLGRVAWLDPRTGFAGWAEGGERVPVALEPHGLLLLDLVAPERLDDERAFLAGWRSGGDEAAVALRSLDSLRRERAAGVRADLAPAGAVIVGEPSDWTLSIRNENTDTLVLRADGLAPLSVPPGETRAARLTIPAADTATRVVAWTLGLADGPVAEFARAVRARPVPPVEATGPGARFIARESVARLPVRLQNHSAAAREAVVEWGSERRAITLAAGADETITLPVERPSAGAGRGALAVPMKLIVAGRVWWEGECRVVFLDARASLSSEPGVQVSADSTFGGYSTRALHDGVADGENLAWNEAAWASEDGPGEHWVRFAFPAPTAVEEVVIHWHREGGVTYTGREGLILGEVPTGQELPIANWKSSPGERATRVAIPRQMLKSVRVVQGSGRGEPERPGIMWVSEVEIN